jgi:hypothetical protein
MFPPGRKIMAAVALALSALLSPAKVLGQAPGLESPEFATAAEPTDTALTLSDNPDRKDLWLRAEYLMWWTKALGLPPLVTTSPLGTPPDKAGELGRSLELGMDETNLGDVRSGGRVTLGAWLVADHWIGLETSFLFLGQQGESYRATSEQFPILARPFFNVLTGEGDAFLVAHRDFLSGSVTVAAENEFLGSESLLRVALVDDDSFHLHGLFGYRFAHLKDRLRISQTSAWTVDDGFIYEGTTKQLWDEFAAKNQFHGGTLGLAIQLRRPRWFLNATGKASLGSTFSTVWIDGSTTTTVPGAGSATDNSGLLALGTNLGKHNRSGFSVIPEAEVTLGYNVTSSFQVFLGYQFLYWSGVARPGDQIDLSLNPSQFPPGTLDGPVRPAFPGKTSGFWAQGLNFGLEWRF